MKDKMSSHIQEFRDLNELRQVILSKSNECKRARKKNPDFKVNPSKIDNLKAACKALVRADSYNGSLLRGILAADIQDNHVEAIRVYDIMIERLPNNLSAFFHYCKFLHRIEHFEKLDEVTSKMMRSIEDTSVPTDEWVEAHLTRAQALVSQNIIEEGIAVLEQLVHIIPPLPISGLIYIQKVENKKRVNPEEEMDNNGSITIGYDRSKDNQTIAKPLKVDDFIQGESNF